MANLRTVSGSVARNLEELDRCALVVPVKQGAVGRELAQPLLVLAASALRVQDADGAPRLVLRSELDVLRHVEDAVAFLIQRLFLDLARCNDLAEPFASL